MYMLYIIYFSVTVNFQRNVYTPEIPKQAGINPTVARESCYPALRICFEHEDHRPEMFDQP